MSSGAPGEDYDLLKAGAAFEKAARCVFPNMEMALPGYSLISQAIELYLKSYLVSKGFTTKVLSKKPFSHDLMHALSTAEANGFLKVTDQERTLLALLSEYHSRGRAFNYKFQGDFQPPSREWACSFASKIGKFALKSWKASEFERDENSVPFVLQTSAKRRTKRADH